MSSLHATDDFITGTWTLDIQDLAPDYADLYITFTEDAPVVEFKNLKFGYELFLDEVIAQSKNFPPEGVKYVQSDQPYLVVERLNLELEKTYSLFLWCENDGKRFEKTFEFTTPRPTQPFDSWVWNETEQVWEAPVAYPDDGESYVWDENATSWVLEEE